MAQEIINYGNTANDGTGDALRNAFIKVDNNFDQIWAAGPVGSNITVLNNTVAVTNTNGNLILSPNGVGIIQTNRPLYPRLDNTYDLGNANLRYRSIFVGAGGINNDGNLTLGNISNLRIPGGTNGYVIQTDGAGNLSWVAQSGAGNGSPGGSNTQVQFNNGGLFGGSNTFTFSNATSTLSVGNIVTGSANITSSGNSWRFQGATLTSPGGGSWTSIAGVNPEEYIDAAANGFLNFQTVETGTNLTTRLHLYHGELVIDISNGTLKEWTFDDSGSFNAPGDIYTPGNISGAFILGDGSQLTNLPGGVIQANVPPASPNDTTLWWDEITGRLYVWYTDVDGSQWVDAAPAAAGPTYGNANVATYLAVGGLTTAISTTGSITGSNLSAVNLVINNITSDDSSLVNINDGVNVNGEILVNGNININGGGIAQVQNEDLTISVQDQVANGWSIFNVVNDGTGNTVALTRLQRSDFRIVTDILDGAYFWIFDNTGNLTLPGNTFAVNYANGTPVSISGGNATLPLSNGTSNINIATANGNATITANAITYTFGTDSTLTLPGGSRLRPLGANLDIFAGTGSYVNLITSDESSYMGVGGAGGYVVTAGGTWDFNTNGNLTAPGNVTAKTFVTTPVALANLTAVAGARAFVSDGNLAAAGNFGAQIGNAGSNVVPVYSDGANWYIG